MPQSGFGRLPEEVFAGLDPIYGNGCNVCRIAMISTMRTARPTTGSPLSVFEAGIRSAACIQKPRIVDSEKPDYRSHMPSRPET
jgi:hypothetical protein